MQSQAVEAHVYTDLLTEKTGAVLGGAELSLRKPSSCKYIPIVDTI